MCFMSAMNTNVTPDAWALLRQAEASASDASAWLKAAQALSRIGEQAASEQAFARYVDLAPGRKALAEGSQRHQAGDLEGAARLYREAIAADPRNVDALRLFALASAALGHRNEALAAGREAITIAPNYPAAWDAFGVALAEAERVEDAVQAFARVVSLTPRNPTAHAKLAHAFVIADEMEGAERAYRAALQLRPDDGMSLLGLGTVMKTLGRADEAIACFRRCVELYPQAGEAWWNLANMKTYRFTEADVAAMRALLDDSNASPSARANTLYALGKAYEDSKQYDAAFASYAQGAAQHRASLRYESASVESMSQRVVSVFTRDFIAARKGQGCADPAPIFIVGMPRSGSTLVEQILASHSLVGGGGELSILGRMLSEMTNAGISHPEILRDFTADDFREMGETYIKRAERHRGDRPYFIDKTPQNFGSIGLIALILPKAKIIDARRHPLDSCFGSFKQMFAQGQTYSYDLDELGRFYLQYERLMQHWNSVLPGHVLRVDYEDMVLDQERQTRRLLDYCGLSFEPACLNFHETQRAVNTASSEQVRQPLYKSSLGAWRRFAPHLKGLEAQLAPALAALPPHIRNAGA